MKLDKKWVLLGLLFSTELAFAQRFDGVVIESKVVAENLYMLTGAGGNIGLVTGSDRTFVIDDQFAELAPRIRAKIAELTHRPADFVLNTHWHGDHTGGNEAFGEAGAVLVAHDNVRSRMSSEQFNTLAGRAIPASPAAALPVITFSETATFHVAGKTLKVTHLHAAHTDGDAVVYFVEDNVLHTGDLFFNQMYPYIDVAAGGSIRGMARAAGEMLAMVDDETQIIPGHGPLATRDDLRAFRDFLTTIADGIDALIAEGRTLEQVIEAEPTKDFDERFNAKGFFKPADWVRLVYSDLTHDRSQ